MGLLDRFTRNKTITGDAPGNVEFYVGVLGLRMVKKTVNEDDPRFRRPPVAAFILATRSSRTG